VTPLLTALDLANRVTLAPNRSASSAPWRRRPMNLQGLASVAEEFMLHRVDVIP